MVEHGASRELDGRTALVVLGELTRTAVGPSDVVDVLMLISERAVDLLPITAAGVLLRDGGDMLHVVGSSGTSPRTLELLRTHAEAVLATGLQGDVDPGPSRPSRAETPPIVGGAGETDVAEVRVASSFPMATGDMVLGLLGTFGRVPLGVDDAVLAQALADLAALALLRTDAGEDAGMLVRRVHGALQARATLAQAVGVVAARFALDPDAALRRLRRAAVLGDVGLVALATAVVAREGALPALLDVAAEER